MDWLVAAAIRPSDCYPKVVATHGAVSGKIDGHLNNVALDPLCLNRRIFCRIFAVLTVGHMRRHHLGWPESNFGAVAASLSSTKTVGNLKNPSA